MTMTLVSTVTVGAGGAASIEFTNIPQSGTDLLVVLSHRISGGSGGAAGVKFNGSTTSFSARRLYGNGSTASSTTETYGWAGVGNDPSHTASTFSNNSIYIPNYSGSTNKSFSVDSVYENNATTAFQDIAAGLWATTAAINSISLYLSSGNFVQYSTASLYTITKGNGGAVVS